MLQCSNGFNTFPAAEDICSMLLHTVVRDMMK